MVQTNGPLEHGHVSAEGVCVDANSNNGSGGSNGLRILVVEDHEDTLRVMVRLLELAGHSVRTAGGVGEALEAASGEAFDLIISDVGLPEGRGLDVMRK